MIIIKNNKEVDLMRSAGRIIVETLLLAEEKVRPGITTVEVDRIAEEFVTKHGVRPSFKGLYGFPASLCISVNEQVVHGIPGGYVLKDGDIVSVGYGAYLNGFYGGAARTFAVGNVNEEANKLIKVTEQSFFKGIECAEVGNRLIDISHEIQGYIEAPGFAVVRDFVGHGIGRVVHEDPDVPNLGKSSRGPKLVQGMALAIKPMVNLGSYKVKTLSDDRTAVTSGGGLSVHYENAAAILPDGPEILTLIRQVLLSYKFV